MNPRLQRRLFINLLKGLLVLMLVVPVSAAFAQDFSPQAAIGGSIQQGSWYEQWNQGGTVYCPNNNQRFITVTSEPFTLSAPAGEAVIRINYSNSRITKWLARSNNGGYVFTETTNWYVHLFQVTPVSPSQMNVVSTFYAQDGSCTLTSNATWSFSGAPQPPPPTTGCSVTPNVNALNKRSGPGVNYQILGQLRRGQFASVTNVAYDNSGQRWWFLSDNTWVSASYTIASGNCPN